MFSSAEHFAGAGAGGGDNRLPMQHQHDQDSIGQVSMYHVPQHSRREKLRFPQEDQLHPSPPAPLLLLNDPNDAVAPLPVTSSIAPFYHANSFASFLPSSSSSLPCSSNSSAYYYANQNPCYSGFAPPTQCLGNDVLTGHSHQAQNQISTEVFSLSLSSSFLVPSPRPLTGSRPVPIGPFTGYSAVLSRSRYLEPARKLLDEVCEAGHVTAARGNDVRDKDMMFLDADPSLEVTALANHGADCRKENCDPVIPNTEQQLKKTRLICLLDEIYKRYKQYYQQVQAVMASFEAVAGLSNATPFASMALKAMSKHFRSLKNIISDQLRQTNKVLSGDGTGREETSTFGHLNGGDCLQRASAYNPGVFNQPHVWRPQRGLPERAVAVLRAWLFEHFLHPYPSDADKQILAKQTGLTRNQVSNWFINARVRLWKPMVEEIHSLEMRQKNKVAPTENECSTDQQPQIASSSKATPFNGAQLSQIPCNQTNDECSMPENVQEEPIQMPNHARQQPMDFSYDSLSSPHHFPVGVGGVGNGGNAGVSLTLGLQHQDSGISFSEHVPLNVARRFGLELCSDTYVINSFGGQERLFAKDASGRLVHDLVG